MSGYTSNDGSDHLSIKAERFLPRKVQLPNIYFVEKAKIVDWDNRNEELSFIPVGSLALDFTEVNLRPREDNTFDEAMIAHCIEKGTVKLYHVVGHSKTDGRPELLQIGSDSQVPFDLPLVPLKPKK